jgi:hypothetical protein
MNHRGPKQLLACCVAGAIFWLVVLPWIARTQYVGEMIRRNEAAGIDPSAMFYTELEHLTYRDGLLRKAADKP